MEALTPVMMVDMVRTVVMPGAKTIKNSVPSLRLFTVSPRWRKLHVNELPAICGNAYYLCFVMAVSGSP